MRRETTFVIAVAVLVLLSAACDVDARTWYINEAGTGDAPTIQAAMDSAAHGDTVLVGPGTYPGEIVMTDGVTLRSEMGPAVTILDGGLWMVRFDAGVSGALEGFTITGDTDIYYRTVALWQAHDFLIRGNVIEGNQCGGVYCEYSHDGEIAGNTIVNNILTGIYVLNMSWDVSVHDNICVGNSDGIGVSESTPDLECNNSWGNVYSDYFPEEPWEPWPWGSNMSEDPLFCDGDAGDFTLNTCSPCLPGNHPGGYDCGLIGAFGQGCDYPSAVQSDTWSMIKALFR